MATGRRIIGSAIVLVVVAAAFAGGWFVGRTGIGSTVDPASLTDVESAFAERMSNVALVGTFTTDGSEDRPRSPDRYEITSVEKVGDGLWRFNADMDCCGVNGPIPIVLPVRWVGDTPMIMMTDTSIPGVGTFTVRLFFYEDRYAGTWQHGEIGGHMSGRIERQAPTGQ